MAINNFKNSIEAILEVKNLGIDYDSFENGDELADWLNGRHIPEFDEPMSVTEEQRAALREIYERRQYHEKNLYNQHHEKGFRACIE